MNQGRQQPNTTAADVDFVPSAQLLDDVEEHLSSCRLSDMEKAMLGEDIVPCGGCIGSNNLTCPTLVPAATRVLYRGTSFCQGGPAQRDLALFILEEKVGCAHSDHLPDKCMDSCPRSTALVPNEFVEKLVFRVLSCQQKSEEEYCEDLVHESELIHSLGEVASFEIGNFLSVSSETSSTSSTSSGVSASATEIEEIVSYWGFGGLGIKFRGECVIAHMEGAREHNHLSTHLLMETMIAIIVKLNGICQRCIDAWLEARKCPCGDRLNSTTRVVPNWERHSCMRYNKEIPLGIPHGGILTSSLWILTHSTWNLYVTPPVSGLGLLGRAIALADNDTGLEALLKSGYLRFTRDKIEEGPTRSYLSIKEGYENVLMLGTELQVAINTTTCRLYDSAKGSDLVASEEGLTSLRVRRRKMYMIAAMFCTPTFCFILFGLILRVSGANLSGIISTLAGSISGLITAWLLSNSDNRQWLWKGSRVSRSDMTDADKAKCIILANSSSTASKIFDGKKMGPTGLLYSGSLEPGRPMTAEELTALGYVRVRGTKVIYNWVTGDWRRITFRNGSACLDRTGELLGTFEVKPLRANYSVQ